MIVKLFLYVGVHFQCKKYAMAHKRLNNIAFNRADSFICVNINAE